MSALNKKTYATPDYELGKNSSDTLSWFKIFADKGYKLAKSGTNILLVNEETKEILVPKIRSFTDHYKVSFINLELDFVINGTFRFYPVNELILNRRKTLIEYRCM